jgi:hypothetical protein
VAISGDGRLHRFTGCVIREYKSETQVFLVQSEGKGDSIDLLLIAFSIYGCG